MEVLIALTVISIVSVTALSIATKSAKHTANAMHKINAQYLVADVLECYKSSGSTAEFYDALDFRGGLSKADPNDSDSERWFTMEDSGYIVLINADDAHLYIVVRNVRENVSEPVAELTYQRTGGA